MNGIDLNQPRGDDELAPYALELCVNDLALRSRDMLPPPTPDETPPDEVPRSPSDDPLLHLRNQTAGGISLVFHLEGVKNPGFSIRTV